MMLIETFFSAFPPPTDKISSASPPLMREPSSHLEKTVSHPSSFTRAVSSDTLSVGA